MTYYDIGQDCAAVDVIELVCMFELIRGVRNYQSSLLAKTVTASIDLIIYEYLLTFTTPES